MNEELKPCPFCGGDAELDTMQAYRNISTKGLAYQAAVYCTQCSAHMTFCYADAPGIPREGVVADTINNWNQRVGQ